MFIYQKLITTVKAIPLVHILSITFSETVDMEGCLQEDMEGMCVGFYLLVMNDTYTYSTESYFNRSVLFI